MKKPEVLVELEKIKEWLDSPTPGWNYFGQVDGAQTKFKTGNKTDKR